MHYLIRSLQVHLSTDSPPGGADNTTSDGAGGLDILSLDTTVQELFTVGLAPTTLKVYRTGTIRYTSFCVLYNVTQSFPVSEDVLSEEACKWTAPQHTLNYLKSVGSDASLLVGGEVRQGSHYALDSSNHVFLRIPKSGRDCCTPRVRL